MLSKYVYTKRGKTIDYSHHQLGKSSTSYTKSKWQTGGGYTHDKEAGTNKPCQRLNTARYSNFKVEKDWWMGLKRRQLDVTTTKTENDIYQDQNDE